MKSGRKWAVIRDCLKKNRMALLLWGLMLLTPLVFRFAHGPMAVLVVVLYGLSHIPCIIIQRYNRPRLCALLKRCQRKGKEPA